MTENQKMSVVYLKTPLGWLKVTADDVGVTSIRFLEKKPSSVVSPKGTSFAHAASQELKKYFKGERISFKTPLHLKGTAFQKKVWNTLRKISYGKTVSYSEIAKKIDCPKGARAVGMANHVNPIPIFVPCHRVIGQSGKLTGYAGGLEKKAWLLSLEQSLN